MAVTPRPNDAAGAVLATNVTTMAATPVKSTAQAAAVAAALDQAQRELVYHYLDVGRLTAANILSTMT
jgi:hypothetical protein